MLLLEHWFSFWTMSSLKLYFSFPFATRKLKSKFPNYSNLIGSLRLHMNILVFYCKLWLHILIHIFPGFVFYFYSFIVCVYCKILQSFMKFRVLKRVNVIRSRELHRLVQELNYFLKVIPLLLCLDTFFTVSLNIIYSSIY